ncbi:hypothetical protein [Fibrobacter intestinalis]|uniref:MotA/TolQ/ExbB proton channel domain-containing protein n=1 Tax=Fibrobacter intestinalis TaxID=28122 RepID=A0A1T4REE5_9BACT|nr:MULTISPECIES: hypothetical protein [Fibrobacter]PBC73515.1 hypothetical protein BGW94_1124 [Fibrobacter sp. NR9]SKA13991.1 hypothetical protein SAMN02745108_02661 [Fibrobacter intestinalis]
MEYLYYLIPSDSIQLVFLIVIAGLSFGTAAWLLLTANEKAWEKVWQNGTFDDKMDDLSAEHGSVIELADAVALPSEKFAEVLPSMLLVIGLLGTFLGVGVALNAAADVLDNKNVEPAELLAKMMPMLGGLGALFKSSIYGIIFFFLFTLWRSKFGRNKERFNWCVKQCNNQLKLKNSFAAASTNKIVKALSDMQESLGKNLGDCIRNSLLNSLESGFGSLEKGILLMNKNLCKTLEETVVERFKALEGEFQELVDETKRMTDKIVSVSTNITKMTKEMDSLSTSMKNEFESVSESADKMGTAAASLTKSVDDFTPAVTNTLNSIQTQFVESINASSSVMEQAGDSIRQAVVTMADESQKGQKKLNDTLDVFEKNIRVSLKDIKDATTTMGVVSGDQIHVMEGLKDGIEERLSSISRANLKISSEMNKLPGNIAEILAKTLNRVPSEKENDLSRKG